MDQDIALLMRTLRPHARDGDVEQVVVVFVDVAVRVDISYGHVHVPGIDAQTSHGAAPPLNT